MCTQTDKASHVHCKGDSLQAHHSNTLPWNGLPHCMACRVRHSLQVVNTAIIYCFVKVDRYQNNGRFDQIAHRSPGAENRCWPPCFNLNLCHSFQIKWVRDSIHARVRACFYSLESEQMQGSVSLTRHQITCTKTAQWTSWPNTESITILIQTGVDSRASVMG